MFLIIRTILVSDTKASDIELRPAGHSQVIRLLGIQAQMHQKVGEELPVLHLTLYTLKGVRTESQRVQGFFLNFHPRSLLLCSFSTCRKNHYYGNYDSNCRSQYRMFFSNPYHHNGCKTTNNFRIRKLSLSPAQPEQKWGCFVLRCLKKPMFRTKEGWFCSKEPQNVTGQNKRGGILC